MKKLLLILSLVLISQSGFAVEVEDEVREPQTIKDNKKEKDENYENKEATAKIKAEKEKKYHERTHKWMDKAK